MCKLKGNSMDKNNKNNTENSSIFWGCVKSSIKGFFVGLLFVIDCIFSLIGFILDVEFFFDVFNINNKRGKK